MNGFQIFYHSEHYPFDGLLSLNIPIKCNPVNEQTKTDVILVLIHWSYINSLDPVIVIFIGIHYIVLYITFQISEKPIYKLIASFCLTLQISELLKYM